VRAERGAGADHPGEGAAACADGGMDRGGGAGHALRVSAAAGAPAVADAERDRDAAHRGGGQEPRLPRPHGGAVRRDRDALPGEPAAAERGDASGVARGVSAVGAASRAAPGGAMLDPISVNGEPPAIVGLPCEELMVSEYWHEGKLIEPAN